METLKNYLQGIANNNEIKTTNSKIEQRTRNAIRNEFADLLTKALQENVGCQDIIVVRTKEGVGIALDNAKVGFIPIVLKPIFKDTAEDILELAEDYERELEQKKIKQEKKEYEKALKIAKQKQNKAKPQDADTD